MNGRGDPHAPDSPETDPGRIRVLAVHTDDVLTALEARERTRRSTVLRVAPPFSGRKRARLHVEGGEGSYDADSAPLHLSPASFVGDVPEFPTVDETEDDLRERGEYSVERHREAYAAAVDDWREAVRTALLDRIEIETATGAHEVRVAYLG